MAICASCGAASAEGASVCASCGRPAAPPPLLPPAPLPPPVLPPAPPAQPAEPPSAPAAASSAPPLPDLPPPVLPPPPPDLPPAAGSWGAGRPYDPAGARPAALAWLTGADWRPALRAVVAPTAVLLLAALIAAVPESDYYSAPFHAPSFGKRLGSSLAMALGALGAPYRLSLATSWDESSSVFRALPMTVTVLWLLALWLGLRVGARRRQQRTGEQQTRRQAAAEAVRTAVVAAAATLLLGLACGARWHPGGSGLGMDSEAAAQELGRTTYSASAGWWEAVAWTALLAGLVAFAVYGTDALRWAAWRNRAVRGWAVAGLAAGRALAVSVALAAVAGFLVVAVRVDGDLTGAAVAFLPNLGLLLLGVGSGAVFRASSSIASDGAPDWRTEPHDTNEYSFFDPGTAGTDWRWSVLLALVSAAVLGRTAFRRRLDPADRLRLAAVYAVGLSLLMLVPGTLVSTESVVGPLVRSRDFGSEDSLALVPWTLLVANAVWAAVGALAVPPLLAALDRRPAPPADRDPGEPGGTPMVLEVVDSEDRRHPAGPVPGDDGPVDPSVWSRRA
ncbi:hypothetical protein [Kitasatospora purpeofusca]|uniref:hypothetical protein n=1 Tax=Kitasatospora purpeofusca TaxID=67352 RepID=UPI002255D1ED|nr:hypothetical protein [Kitasatospora purpeofusca]MCX4753253.1 hypothetical protein [Kitasatospora purpeofusca]WSR32770.1 hypothetical protein OG715_18330 [Kitasatospora purpeofusca]